MTDDYKTKLLKYLTGKLDSETGINEPQFANAIETSNNIRYQIAQEISVDYTNIIFRQQLYSEEYETFLILGFNNAVDPVETFIAVINKDMELLQYINTFNDNSSFFNIVCLNQDEDGYIYGVSRNDETIRVLLFNNIFSSGQKTGVYEVTLRRSYIVPSNLKFQIVTINGSRQRIIKSYGEAVYYITGYDYDTTSTLKVIKFQINIGSDNTWDTYTISNSFIGQSDFTVLLQKTENGVVYNLYGLNTYDYNNVKYSQYRLSENGTWTLIKNISVTGSISTFTSQVLALNNENVYVVTERTDAISTTIYKVDNNSLKQLYVSNGYVGETDNQTTFFSPSIYLQNINNNIFIFEIQNIENSYSKEKIGMIIGENVFIEEVGMVNYCNMFSSRTFCLITNQYNLYNINVISDVDSNNQYPVYNNKYISLIYNSNNYNGLPYEAPNCLVPNSGILYDDNDDVIFARNLYNKTVSGQTTTSTVQIPNTLLNNDTIAQNDLIGQTNGVLVSDNTQFTKNIYETVDLNFSNTLIIRNDNDENNKILNPIGSARLNNSVSQAVDYDNAQATKIRINYADNTNEIITLSSSQIKLVSNNTAKYVFSVYVKKEISNIQIISHDENTTYQTINNLSLTAGKIYNFIQYVSTLEEIVRDEILYNNEAINYNDEPVLYIN